MKNAFITILCGLVCAVFTSTPHIAQTESHTAKYTLKLKAADQFQRSAIADTGAAIEFVSSDYVIATVNLEEKNILKKMNVILEDLSSNAIQTLGFPSQDSEYHDYSELLKALQDMHAEFPQITQLKSIGRSVEGRDLWALVVRGEQDMQKKVPQIVFMGGHHAREHLSVDTPLRLMQWFLSEYKKGDSEIVHLVNTREIHLIPAVNPDGLEFDISGNSYKSWRKNRSRNSNGTFGVDLNRNYGYGWGTGGSSNSPSSDTYKGPAAFSEPETQAIKNYVESLSEIKVLLSYHTFSSLILYPWGAKYDKIPDEKDYTTFVKMAEKMATWTGYTPQQSSELYIASGDTTDWAYGTRGIFAFTFELDPRNQWGSGGFYPGDEIIESVVEKNKKPFIYLIDLADDPHRALDFGIGI